MSRVLLFECSPRRISDGVVVAQRFCYKAVGAANYLGQSWEPVVIAPPEFTSAIGFDGRDFSARPETQNGDLSFVLTPAVAGAARLIWKDADVVIKAAAWLPDGGRPADGAFAEIWKGKADELTTILGVARVTLVDAGQVLRAPAAVTKFGSAGNALLDSADAVKDRAAGTVVPQAWGQVLGIPGILVDRANGIYLFANSVATAVAGFYDGGAPFTLGVARASLAALQGNVPAAGAVDYCLNAGGMLLARPWDTPNFPFTCDATFGNTRAADIASAIVASRSALTFKAGVVAAFNALQGAACGIYVDDDASLGTLLDRIFGGLGAFWRLTAAGTIDIQRIGFAGSPALTVNTFRGRPSRQRIIVPTGRRSLGYARNNRVHSESEIAAIVLVEASDPVLSRLSPTSGQAASNFTASDGNPYSRIVASGDARDGDVVSFPSTLPGVPKITFLPGGNAATAGQNINIIAEGLSASGFTMKAKGQGVTVGSTITDSPSSGGGGGEPTRVINRSNSGAPFNGRFTFRYQVTVGNIAPGEPGFITVIFWVKRGGSWQEAGRDNHSVSGTFNYSVTPGTVDFGGGNEFGMSVDYAEGSGTALTSFINVSYTLGTVTETSLTPSGASAIPWIAFL